MIPGLSGGAKGYAEAGIKPVKVATELELPEELAEALEADVELAEAFHALTPGRQRSYVIHLSSAKEAGDWVARVASYRSASWRARARSAERRLRSAPGGGDAARGSGPRSC